MTNPSGPPLRLPQPPEEDVFTATEEVRAADFPNVPAELLVAVLTAEQNNPDNRSAAARAVAQVVDAWLIDHADEPTAGSTLDSGGAE
ncbi:hypothetical protein NUM_44320 [Actinocatenispora comari]|uniref:Uncharacterized protein n=1 Tax=Actinocatenispora comari TaxID=2807577 RepID=A0A8J4AIB4_9ACTN|nr:hypothetical protein NUM_44320 [Actinocatenispora comari]